MRCHKVTMEVTGEVKRFLKVSDGKDDTPGYYEKYWTKNVQDKFFPSKSPLISSCLCIRYSSLRCHPNRIQNSQFYVEFLSLLSSLQKVQSIPFLIHCSTEHNPTFFQG